METAHSADGTRIAYDRTGSGPSLVLITGAFGDRNTTKALSALLAGHFTVLEYDRRGRGDSGDVQPYAPEREIEDLAAVIAAGGGAAGVFGHSSGGALGLEAAARGLPITGLIAYEPPYTTPDDGEASDVPQRVAAHIAAGRRREAIETFLTDAVGVPAAMLPMIENSPDFPGMLAVAHTLPYDFAVCGDGRVPAGRFARIAAPTLVVNGANSQPWAARVTDAVAAAIPGASRQTLQGQDHGAAPDVVAPVIVEFLGRVEAPAPRAQ